MNTKIFALLTFLLLPLYGSLHAQMTVSAPSDPKGITNPIVEDGHPNCELNLSVEITGGAAPYTYRWMRGATQVSTSANLVIRPSSLANQGTYTCIVRDSAGITVTSPPSRVTVLNISDSNSLAIVGQAATTMTVVAQSPSTLAYRWHRMVGDTETPISTTDTKYAGATSATLTIRNVSEADATTYFCKVFANGYSMDSGVRRLVVVPAPTSKIVSADDPVELEVSPVGATPSILSGMTYEWRRGTTVVGNTNVLSFQNVTNANAGDYTCVVRLTASSPSVTTAIARIDVVTSTPRVQLVAEGAASVILTAEVSPAVGTRTFRWFKEGSAVPIANAAGAYSGATTNALTVLTVTTADAGDYYCEITAYGDSVNSANRKLLVAGNPTSKLVKMGDAFQLETIVHGSDPAIDSDLTYVWRKAGVEQTAQDGANGEFFDVASSSLSDAAAYTCAVTYSPSAATVTPLAAQVSVVNADALTKMIFSGADSSFTVQTQGVGMSYQWSFFAPGPPGSPGILIPIGSTTKYVTSATLPLLTVKAATLNEGGRYRCRVSAFGQSVEADFNRLVVLTRPVNSTVQVGANLSLAITSSGQDSPEDLSYSWFKRVDTTDELVDDQSTFTINNVTSDDAATYSCVVTLNSVSPAINVTASNIVVSVLAATPDLHLGLAAASVIINMPASAVGVTYQWHKVGVGPLPVETTLPATGRKYMNVTTRSLTVQNLTLADAGEYFCVVKAAGVEIALKTQTLDVVASPTSMMGVVGDDLSFTVETAGTIAELNYQWRRPSGRATVNVGTNSPSLDFPSAALTDGNSYTCVVSIPGVTSTTASVTTRPATFFVVNPNALDVVVDTTKSAILRVGVSPLVLPVGTAVTWFKKDGDSEAALVQATPAKYVGLTTAALTVLNCQEADAGDYICQFTVFGKTVRSSEINLFVRFRPEVQPITFPMGIIGGFFEYQIPVDPDPRKVPVSYTAAPLPAGLRLNTTTGVISGRPTVAFNTNVTVRATNTAGVSTPVVANLTVGTLPTYLAGTYVGVLPRSDSFGANPLGATLGGRFDMTVTSTGAATGTLRLGTLSYAFAVGSTLNVIGTDSSTATATAAILVPRGTGASALTPLRVTFEIPNSSSPLANVLVNAKVEDSTNDEDFVEFEGWRNSYTVASPATAYQATVNNFGLLPPDGSDPATIPQGIGHGSFGVSNLGVYAITGRTADGETITTSGFVGPSGQALIYQTMYLTTLKGSLVGAFSIDSKANASALDNTIEPSATIPITWYRPEDTRSTATPPTMAQRTYRAGFDAHQLMIEGSTYVPPVLPNVILGLTASTTTPNAKLTLIGGGIQSTTSPTDTFSYQGVRIGASSVATMTTTPNPNLATMTLAPVAATGRFSGTFTMRDELLARPATTYQGVIYSVDGVLKGVGYYLHNTKITGATLTDLVLSGVVNFERL